MDVDGDCCSTAAPTEAGAEFDRAVSAGDDCVEGIAPTPPEEVLYDVVANEAMLPPPHAQPRSGRVLGASRCPLLFFPPLLLIEIVMFILLILMYLVCLLRLLLLLTIIRLHLMTSLLLIIIVFLLPLLFRSVVLFLLFITTQ